MTSVKFIALSDNPVFMSSANLDSRSNVISLNISTSSFLGDFVSAVDSGPVFVFKRRYIQIGMSGNRISARILQRLLSFGHLMFLSTRSFTEKPL
jgi:hypothetical protein